MVLKKKAKKKIIKKKAVKRKVVKKRALKKKITGKKAPKKKVAKKKAVLKKAPAVKKVEGNVIGTVTHYFPHVRAAVVKLKTNLAVGDTIKIKGHTTDFTQAITSMQIDHVPVDSAKKGDEIGLLVNSRTRQNDTVYKI